MAVTKIHPIKSTLNLAIDYITRDDKTDEKILVSTNNCYVSTAHLQFLQTRNIHEIKGTVLARHLIQSFLPGETTPEIAHKIGTELCKKILKDEYEFVIATHIDRGHIHNHIIFNNVNIATGKCYQSNKKSYHKIRYQSDKLCKEYGLSIIDKYYEEYKNKYKTKGKSWYENEQFKKGTSWKSKLQFDIDRMIEKAKNFDDFIKRMQDLDYEIKHGKHIAFKHKDKTRFTRAKTIGEYYTEENIQKRIKKAVKERKINGQKSNDYIIDINNNSKIKSSKAYEHWARKHNLKTASDMVILMREKGFNSIKQLDEFIKNTATKRQEIQDKIKEVENRFTELSSVIENVNTVNKYRQVYKIYSENKHDKYFYDEYKSQIVAYETALKKLKENYTKMPNTKDILSELDALNEKKNTLMNEYSSSKVDMEELYKIRKNYEKFMGKEMER